MDRRRSSELTMGLFAIPLRLAARASLVAADVAALFAPIVSAINGNIDASNYAPAARIPNALKLEPYSVFALEARYARPAVTLFPVLPIPVHSKETVIFGWDVIVNDGTLTADVQLLADGVQIGTTQSPAGATGVVASETFADVSNVTRLQVSIAGAASGGSVHVVVWCRNPHVR
jgi:hypothetical protein